ncbi:MAG: hypothetical protein JWN70_4605 [Planctomycetaceae bacterium]|nr:hypothetical protein [Planctomycetaceae bacterium]
MVIEKFDNDLVSWGHHSFLTHLAIKLACTRTGVPAGSSVDIGFYIG